MESDHCIALSFHFVVVKPPALLEVISELWNSNEFNPIAQHLRAT
jgi:hypothetical protein